MRSKQKSEARPPVQMAGASVWLRERRMLPQGLLHELDRLRRLEGRAARKSVSVLLLAAAPT